MEMNLPRGMTRPYLSKTRIEEIEGQKRFMGVPLDDLDDAVDLLLTQFEEFGWRNDYEEKLTADADPSRWETHWGFGLDAEARAWLQKQLDPMILAALDLLKGRGVDKPLKPLAGYLFRILATAMEDSPVWESGMKALAEFTERVAISSRLANLMVVMKGRDEQLLVRDELRERGLLKKKSTA